MEHITLVIEANIHHIFPLDWKIKRGREEGGMGIEKCKQKL
jgi:hypothetical protein